MLTDAKFLLAGLLVIGIAAIACGGSDGELPAATGPPAASAPAATAASAAPSDDEQAIDSPKAWPMFRLNTSHGGAFASSDLTTRPTQVWRFDTGGIVESSPAVVGGILYAGTFNNRLFAIDAATGEQKWEFRVGGLLRASPSVVHGVVFFGADDNRFYAVDAASGLEKWSFGLGGGGEQSSPAVIDGTVYFGAFDDNVYALDADTGEERWRFPMGAGALSSPLVVDNRLFIGSLDGRLYALEADDGGLLWSFRHTPQSSRHRRSRAARWCSGRTMAASMWSIEKAAPNSGGSGRGLRSFHRPPSTTALSTSAPTMGIFTLSTPIRASRFGARHWMDQWFHPPPSPGRSYT
jgi:hypothetical protein